MFNNESSKTDLTRRAWLQALAGTSVLASIAPLRAVKAAPWTVGSTFENTWSAFLDTVVPGPASDPTGAPGALEAGTVQYIDKISATGLLPFPMGAVKAALTTALDGAATLRHFKKFSNLNIEQRTKILESVSNIKGVPMLLRLARAPFYTGAINRAGFDYLQYPGPNRGYSDYSFQEVISQSHPRTVGGNLP